MIDRASHRGERGFTLVEVMVALLIFAMIAAAGIAILSFSIRAQAATSARFDDIAALNRTMSLLSGDLGQAVARPARDESGTMQPAFVGAEDGQLRFVRTGWSNIDAVPRANLQKVAYQLNGGVLQRIAYPMLDGAAPLPPVTLLDHVRLVAVRYRFQGAWSERWDGSQGAPLPQAVEFTIQRDNGTGIRLMLLVGTGYAPLQPASPGSPNAPA